MIEKHRVSIIICFYERIAHLKCCLDSLTASCDCFDEVIIADDGSGEETVRQLNDLIPKYPFKIRHVWQPDQGFRVAAARNNGVREANGDYLVFLDSDFILLPDTLSIHLTRARPGRFLSGYCKYLSQTQTEAIFEKGLKSVDLDNLYANLPDENLKRDHFKFITRTWRIRLGLANARKQTLGGHFSIYRSDLDSVNGYDENFIGWGGEDIDLGIRLAASGIFGRSVIRSARVLHMWHPREDKSADWKKGRNAAYCIRRHISPVCEKGLKTVDSNNGQ